MIQFSNDYFLTKNLVKIWSFILHDYFEFSHFFFFKLLNQLYLQNIKLVYYFSKGIHLLWIISFVTHWLHFFKHMS